MPKSYAMTKEDWRQQALKRVRSWCQDMNEKLNRVELPGDFFEVMPPDNAVSLLGMLAEQPEERGSGWAKWYRSAGPNQIRLFKLEWEYYREGREKELRFKSWRGTASRRKGW